MWIQVRTFDGSRTEQVDSLSKLTKIEEIRERLTEIFEVDSDRQRLFYRGKQLVDGHTLYDYDVRQNDLIQLMIRPAEASKPTEKQSVNETESEKSTTNSEDTELKNDEVNIESVEIEPEDAVPSPSKPDKDEATKVKETENESGSRLNGLLECESPEDAIYKIGDYVDVRDPTAGAWFEGIVVKILKPKPDTDEPESRDQNGNDIKDKYQYDVRLETDNDEDDERLLAGHQAVRPRSRKLVPFTEVEINQQVLVNFNLDDRKKRGYWYDAIVTRKQTRRTQKELFCTVMMGSDLAPLADCQIQFVNELFIIEEPGNQINIRDVKDGREEKPKLRKNKPECDECQDNPNIVCKMCWCNVCGGKDRPELQIMCDECDLAYHITCLNPPLEKIPEDDDWYCPSCKNSADIVKAGDKLKESKKKSKMASAVNKTKRDWGKGMACAGRTKVCTLVPTNHFGAIPGVEVGSLWKYRVQVSEAGVHRPHVAGIAGRESEGAFSIVLSGGYEDDHDNGEEFFYTGSGGRDLSGNKRTAEQSCDQVLTRMNMALAKNCNAPINTKEGAESNDWQKGKPVRVVRNCKAAKHSEYAPDEGNRYDGIYKLVKYWPEKGKSGFLVWRYLFRRDDPTPAPWTKEGKQRIKELGIEMVYPDGYLEAEALKEEKKRKTEEDDSDSPPSKKSKTDKKKKTMNKSPVKEYKIEGELRDLIDSDSENEKIWAKAVEIAKSGKQKFIDFLQEEFMCICCQELICRPVTTPCFHNICKQCIGRAFKAEVYNCPACRTDLGKKYTMPVNEKLSEILVTLFPGYQAGR